MVTWRVGRGKTATFHKTKKLAVDEAKRRKLKSVTRLTFMDPVD